MPGEQQDNDAYVVHRWSQAWGVFRDDDDEPFIVFFDEDIAKDFCTTLNWAAKDRQRHKDDLVSQTIPNV